MGIVSRYLFKEFIPPFLAGTLFFTVLFLLQHLEQLGELMFEKNIPVLLVLELMLYSIPFTAAITIPMGTLFGALFSLGRLSQDSEIVAMRAGGISLLQIFKPMLLLGLILTGFLFYFMNYVLTESNLRYKSIYINIFYSNPGVVMTQRKFTPFADGTQKISAMDIKPDGELRDIYIYDINPELQSEKIIFAKSGRWVNNEFNSSELSLNLYDGEILQMNRKTPTKVEQVKFDIVTINFFNNIRQIDQANEGLREMSVFQIKEIIDAQVDANQPVNPVIYVEYHRKFSIPLACLAFVVIALPLAVSIRQRSRGIGIGVSLFVVFTYYLLMTTFEAMGKKLTIDPRLAMHLPNIVFMGTGIVLMWFNKNN